jgi:hypothetical protein
VRLGRETRHVADRPDDPSSQYGTYAVDLGEGGAGGFHLGFDAPVKIGDLPVERPDVAQHLRSQPRRLRRAEAPWARMPRTMRAARVAESVPATPPGTRSRRSPWRRFSALVRSATRSSRLSERRRSTSEPTSGSTTASRSLREAANAVARASSPSFLRALPAKLESTRTRAESLGGTSTTDSPAAANLPTRCLPRGHRRSPSPNDARGTASPSVLEGSQAGAALREGRTLDELATSFVDHGDGDRRLVGIDPDQDLHERTHLRFGRTSACGVREGHSDFGLCFHTSFESLRPPRAPAGRKPRTSQPVLRATGSSRAIPVKPAT